MAYPTYAEFLREAQEVIDALLAVFQRSGHDPKKYPASLIAPHLYHNAWRRLAERFTHADILREIQGEPPQDGFWPGVGQWGDLKTGGAPPQPPASLPTPPSPDPPPGPPPSTDPEVQGRVRIYGQRSVQDDLGPALQLQLSDFSLLRLFRQDKAAGLARVEQHANKGFTAVRCLAQVIDEGPGWWAGKEIRPDWPDHLDLVVELTKSAYARNLRIGWTILGSPRACSQRDRVDLAIRMAHGLSTASEGVLFVEMCNEPLAQGMTLAECAEMAAAFEANASFPFVVALGASEIEEYRTLNARSANTVLIQHLDRDTSKSELQDRPWRQGWDAALSGLRWVDNEPIGHGSTVNSETRPDVLRSHRLVNYICGAFSSCLHATQPGVYANQPWEDIPAYHQVWKSRLFLPPNLAEGAVHNANANFPGRPFTLNREGFRSETNNMSGLVRLYTREVDGVFYAVPFGLVSDVEIIAEFDMLTQCFSQEAEDLLWARQVGRGEAITLSAATDYLIACKRL